MALTDLTVTVLLFESPGQQAVSSQDEASDAQIFDMSYSGKRFTTHYRRGFWAQVMFSSPGGDPNSNSPFVLDGYDWLVVTGGRRGLSE